MICRSCAHHRLLFGIALALLGLMSVNGAMARQADWSAGLDLAMQPDFIRRDLVLFQTDLQLDSSQVPVLEALYGDYEVAFRQGEEEARKRLSRLRPALGEPDSEMDERRRDIRERVGLLLEETRHLRDNLAEGPNREELRRQFQEKASQLRDELQQLQGEPMTPEAIRDVLRESAVHIEAWQAEKSRLRAEFVANVLAVLNDDQSGLWPALERKLNREKSLGQGRLSGESVNLFHIADEVVKQRETKLTIAAALRDYDTRLDHALRQRHDFMAASQRQLLQAIEVADRKASESIVQKQIQHRVAVRDVNDEFSSIIASQLADDVAAQFIQAFRERGYPRVYRTTQVQRLLNAAQEMDGIDPAVVESIKAIQQAYLAELSAANERLLRTVRLHEPAELVQRSITRWPSVGDQRSEVGVPNSELETEFAKRDELGVRFVRQLQSVLTAPQFARLPGSGAFEQRELEENAIKQP